MLEGTRPMLVELQALVAPAPYGTPRRTTLGLEDARVALLLAVLDRRSPVDILSQDVYAKAAGGGAPPLNGNGGDDANAGDGEDPATTTRSINDENMTSRTFLSCMQRRVA